MSKKELQYLNLGHLDEVRKLQSHQGEMEKGLPLSEKPRKEMRRERLTPSNAPDRHQLHGFRPSHLIIYIFNHSMGLLDSYFIA